MRTANTADRGASVLSSLLAGSVCRFVFGRSGLVPRNMRGVSGFNLVSFQSGAVSHVIQRDRPSFIVGQLPLFLRSRCARAALMASARGEGEPRGSLLSTASKKARSERVSETGRFGAGDQRAATGKRVSGDGRGSNAGRFRSSQGRGSE